MKKTFLLLCLLWYTVLTQAQQPGSIDSTFGNNGIVLSNQETLFRRLAVQHTGKIIVSNEVTDNDTAQIYRYNISGTPDSSFGDAGILRYSYDQFSGASTYIDYILVQEDDKIIVVGRYYFIWEDVFMVRFHKDGAIDSSYGSNGVITYENGTFNTIVDAILQPDGKLIMSLDEVYDGEPPPTLYSMLRYTTNGKPDSSFGLNGRRARSFYNLGKLAVQQNGKILIGKSNFSPRGLAFYRLFPNGQPDSSFGTNGELIVPVYIYDSTFPESVSVNQIALQPSGKLLAAGGVNGYNRDGQSFSSFLLARIKVNGKIDSSFYDDGIAPILLNNPFTNTANNVLVQPDAKILLGGNGFKFNGAGYIGKTALMRFKSNGGFDNSFGTNGTTITPSDSGFAIWNMVLAPDGKIITCGRTSGEVASIARYNGGSSSFAQATQAVAENAIVKQQVQLYPNPASDRIILSGLDEKASNISLYDMQGKLVKTITIQGSNGSVSIKELPAGRYNVRISVDGKVVQSLPFIKL